MLESCVNTVSDTCTFDLSIYTHRDGSTGTEVP